MFNDPDVGHTVSIDGKPYTFIQVPETPDIVYAELGKKAKVYRVLQKNKAFALKVFKPPFRNPKIVKNSNQVSAYKKMKGLSVAERSIITPEKYSQLIADHPDFRYAVLMPWIEGRSWGNYVVTKTSISRSESLRLANAFIEVILNLEENNVAHCDLSGGNFIFSSDFTRVELVDIEEMYGENFQMPDPIPAGTGGYSPDWVKKNGLWDANADRFAAGILICEILGWQFEDIRNKASNGDSFFAEGELCQDSRRYRLMESRMNDIHPELANLLRMVWNARNASECPRIADWKKSLDEIPENSSPLAWGWESLDLENEISTSQTNKVPVEAVASKKPEHPPERTSRERKKHSGEMTQSQPTNKSKEAIIDENSKEPDVVMQPWPTHGNSRKDMLLRIFGIFAVVAAILFLLIVMSGDLIVQINKMFKQQSGWIIVDMVSNGILGLMVGGVHAWIFKYNIRKSHILFFILSSILGGGIGGATVGFLTNLGYITSAITAGTIIGIIGGGVSSLGQNLFMKSQGMQIKWFLFSLISWTVIWVIGTIISWANQTIPGIAATAAVIIILSGAALSMFLHEYPDVEF